MLDWQNIDTVFLDMDGTLLDLYFDNYFWQEYLPVYWGKQQGLDARSARETLLPKLKSKEGTLSWYCLDYWSHELNVDILKLKSDLEHLIQLRPGAREFLVSLKQMGKHPIMVTNAHQDLINMKLSITGIGKYFQHIICSHNMGVAKEQVEFWSRLNEQIAYQPERTVLIDDNITVLRAAQNYGIVHLLGIARPDSQGRIRDTEEFVPIEDFNDIVAGYISSPAGKNKIPDRMA